MTLLAHKTPPRFVWWKFAANIVSPFSELQVSMLGILSVKATQNVPFCICVKVQLGGATAELDGWAACAACGENAEAHHYHPACSQSILEGVVVHPLTKNKDGQ